MPENTQFKCEQEVTMDIQNEMSKNSSTSQSNKNKRQESDLNSKDPCASVPKEAKAECEKGIADARKNQAASKAKAEAEAKAEGRNKGKGARDTAARSCQLHSFACS